MSFAPDLVPVFETIYEDTKAHWDAYHLCEHLVDLETQFQLWRFRHMRTVMRIIGFKRGTGGSSGVGFLQAGAGADLLPGTVRGPHRDRPAGLRAAGCLNAGGVVMRCNITHFRFDWLPQSR